MQSKMNELGIILHSTGRQVCPSCSHTRKNKSDKCLQVTYKDDVILYNCHNYGCSFTGIISDTKYNLEVKPIIYKKPKQPKVIPDKTKVYDYFAKRGISKAIVDTFQIGYTGTEIVFPYYKSGELVNNKYRTGRKTWRQESDSEKTLFAMDICINMIADSQDYTLVLCEGEIDAMSFIEAGIPAVSIPQGASDNKLECISSCYDFISTFNSFVIAVDDDEAGANIKKHLLDRLHKSKDCFVISWQDYDVKDANEALQRGGVELLHKAFAEKTFVPMKGLVDIKQQQSKILAYMFGDYNKGESTGWNDLDKLFRIQGGNLMVITGFPSRGKSTFANNLLYNLMSENSSKHLICSFENTVERHITEFLELHTGKNARDDGSGFGMTTAEAKSGIDYLADKLYLYDTNESLTVDDIIELATYAVERYGVKTLTIDPYNRIKHPSTDREDKYIGEMLSKLSFFAKQYDVLVIFIAHPKKPPQGNADAPNMYDISGSSDWYNMADIGITIHRERNPLTNKLNSITSVLVQKVKGWHIGNPSGGTVKMTMNKNKLQEI